MKLSIAFLALATVCGAQQTTFCSKTPDDHCVADKTVFPEIASIKIVQIGSLKCKDNQHIEGDGKTESANHCVDDAPQHAPLKCGKYQHVEHWAGRCGPAPNQCDADSMICNAVSICTPPPPDHCADNIVTVTEEQWQALVTSLRLTQKLIDNQQKQIDVIVKALTSAPTNAKKPRL